MLNKEHSTLEGIQKIVNIRASLNTGLTENLKEGFPDTLPSQRLESSNSPLAHNIGWQVFVQENLISLLQLKQKVTSLRFSISQHSIDLFLLESFVEFFNCGYVVNYKNRLICEFIVTKHN